MNSLNLVVDYGMGWHASTLDLDAIENVLKLLLGFECMYVTAVALIKFSLLEMYLRIFPSRRDPNNSTNSTDDLY